MGKKTDLVKEIKKYSEVARIELSNIKHSRYLSNGIDRVPDKHQQPFVEYYQAVSEMVYPGIRVLELGAGTGLHSSIPVELGAELTALDISRESLEVLSFRLNGRVDLLCADMSCIPLPDSSFDLIISCGSLSYGNPKTVYKEVTRLLKPGGSIIFLDTLNHNWIYSLNRFRHYIQKKRTFSTLYWMPRMKTIRRYKSTFESTDLRFYGKLLWLDGFLRLIFTESVVNSLLSRVDDSRFLKRSSFKFLLVCRGKLK
jgi:SAM-dependent methyltransferase